MINLNRVKCDICGQYQYSYNCLINGDKVCRRCCDLFQVNNINSHWDAYFKKINCNSIKKEANKCLGCNGLYRDAGQQISVKDNDDFGYSLFYFEFKGQVVFSDNIKQLSPKTVQLIEKLGCETAEDYFHYGEALYSMGRFSEALDSLLKSDRILENEKTCKYLGWCYERLNNDESAEESYLRAIRINSNCAEACRHLGDLYRNKKDYVNSIIYNQKALDLVGVDVENFDSIYHFNYYGLAVSYSKLKLYDKVIEVGNAFLKEVGSWDSIKNIVQEYRDGKFSNIDSIVDIDAVSTILQLIAISHLEKDELEMAEENNAKAKWLCPTDVDVAKVEGIVIGRKFNESKMKEYKELLQLTKINVEQKLLNEIEKMCKDIEKIKENTTADVLDIKPNLGGIGINFNELYRRLTTIE